MNTGESKPFQYQWKFRIVDNKGNIKLVNPLVLNPDFIKLNHTGTHFEIPSCTRLFNTKTEAEDYLDHLMCYEGDIMRNDLYKLENFTLCKVEVISNLANNEIEEDEIEEEMWK